MSKAYCDDHEPDNVESQSDDEVHIDFMNINVENNIKNE